MNENNKKQKLNTYHNLSDYDNNSKDINQSNFDKMTLKKD